jgi:hypothetical protein
MYEAINPYSLYNLQIFFSWVFIYVILDVSQVKVGICLGSFGIDAKKLERIQQKFASVCFYRFFPSCSLYSCLREIKPTFFTKTETSLWCFVFLSSTFAHFVIGPWALELACKWTRIELWLYYCYRHHHHHHHHCYHHNFPTTRYIIWSIIISWHLFVGLPKLLFLLGLYTLVVFTIYWLKFSLPVVYSFFDNSK